MKSSPEKKVWQLTVGDSSHTGGGELVGGGITLAQYNRFRMPHTIVVWAYTSSSFFTHIGRRSNDRQGWKLWGAQ